jgi:suppressor of ftsI
VFIHVPPGQQFEYEGRIPATGRQRPGFFWYHPHAHGFVETQLRGGMSGGLVVDGSERLFPILEGLPERFFLVKHAEIGAENEILSINGQINPMVQIRPGEMQFWRIGHVGATRFIKFRIEGMPLYVVATDGHPLSQPRKMTEFFIGPGQRIDAIAIGPEPGEYAMRTISFQDQAWRKPDPAQPLATVVSAGSGTTSAAAETEVLRQRIDGARWIDEVRSTPIAHRRTLEYSRTPDRQVFMIDGRVMDDDRIDQTVSLGDTEEWTVVNTDQQYHSCLSCPSPRHSSTAENRANRWLAKRSGGGLIAGSCCSASSRYAQKHPGIVFMRKDQIARFALESPITVREGSLAQPTRAGA